MVNAVNVPGRWHSKDGNESKEAYPEVPHGRKVEPDHRSRGHTGDCLNSKQNQEESIKYVPTKSQEYRQDLLSGSAASVCIRSGMPC